MVSIMLTFGYDIESTGPNPFESKVITIQYRRESRNYIFKIWDYDHSERDLILAFLSEWKKIPRRLSHGGDFFITYNFRLDGPFLLTRCLLNDIGGDEESRKHIWNSIIHGPAFLDLYQLLGNNMTPFELWRKKFGLPPGKFRNSDVPQMYLNRQYSDIEEYVNDELISLEKAYYLVIKEPFYVELEELRNKLEPELHESDN